MAVQLDMVAEAGERRRALLAQGRPPVATPRLSMSDVRALQTDRSPAARTLVARKLGEQLDELVTGRHAPHALPLLHLLVRDVSAVVRAALSEAVAQSPSLPGSLASMLATDVIEVARPLLERSPVLGDAELCRIVRSTTPEHAVAIAARRRISEELSENLIATGDRQVILLVLGNTTAPLSAAMLSRVLDDWYDDADVEARLLGRAGLPLVLVERLIGHIDERLARDAARGWSATPEMARERLRAARAQAMAGSANGRALPEQLRTRMAAGELTYDSLVGALREGDLVTFEATLSVMARLDIGPCRRLLYHDDRRHVAALCARADIPAPHYLMLRAALDPAQDLDAPAARSRAAPDRSSASLLEAYERVRHDPELVDRLCHG